jgi:hypothetical protein
MANIIKKVKVKRMVYTFNTSYSFVQQYITNCVSLGKNSILYQPPNIPLAFYTKGTNASGAMQAATTKCAAVPTNANKGIKKVKKTAGIAWLNEYSDLVEVIANDDANRSTRHEAATNIAEAYLSSQKLANSSKGNPETPKISAVNKGNGRVDVGILNGADYKPTLTMFIIIEKAAKAKLTINNGQLSIEMETVSHIVFKVASDKGKYTHLLNLKPGVPYEIYAYAQNGKNKLSALSTAANVTG